ncbi:norrin-like [Diadema setosum]|uniref:norrin-like n=1 Tax=Diadema setosum TaxID=31175 RepID=UPI003B3B7847
MNSAMEHCRRLLRPKFSRSVTMATYYFISLAIVILSLISATTSHTPSSAVSSSTGDRPKCMRYYHTERISHPRKACQSKIVLMSRCSGQCEASSSTDPVVSFKSHLRNPFRYRCQSCQDHVSIMKAVLLRCQGNERLYATYRYILSCECSKCKGRSR